MMVRDVEDHILWLLQHGWHEKALAAVEAGQGRTELLDEVFYVSSYFSIKGSFFKFIDQMADASQFI